MKSIKYRFDYFFERENDCVDEYIALAQAVIYQRFSREDLLESFEKLVPINMRPESQRKDMIDYLEILTNRDQILEEKVGIYFDEFSDLYDYRDTQKRAEITPYEDEF